MKKYITTPIYYVNDKPHIGHAYTTLIADVYARYYRKQFGSDSVFFLTGTDEHGSKVAKAAEDHGISPKAYSDLISGEYKKVWQSLNISYDEFIRTTDPKHENVVQTYLQNLFEKGFIYKGVYKGLYCIGCEKFLSYDEIVNNTCIFHPNIKITEQEEENYFFNLKKFSLVVLKEIEEGSYKILPEQKKNEIVGKIKQGINDISISRVGVEWGIPLPWDTKHTVYVWVDALLNYYSATKIFTGRDKFWPPNIQFIAKDILWFHGLIWEALLLAENLKLPEIIYAHGFFTINGQKMSKTLGNVINPNDLIGEYGVDGARYLLLTSCSFGADGDISLGRFKEKFNADLANGLGNLIARIAKLCEKFDQIPVNFDFIKNNKNFSIDEHMSMFKPDDAVKSIWSSIAEFNQDFNKDKPWELTDKLLKNKLTTYIERILKIGDDLGPFLPFTSLKIIEIFSSKNIQKPESLFSRKE